MIKRSIITFIILALSVQTFLLNINVFAIESSYDYASADLSSLNAKCSNLTVSRMQTGGALLVSRNGTSGWCLDGLQGEDAQKIYVDLNDKYFCKNNDGTEFMVTVEYFDEYNGFFSLSYDAEGGSVKNTDLVYLLNSGTWKTHSFVIEDAYFGNGMKNSGGEKADFCITSTSNRGSSKTAVVIKSIKVKKNICKNPVKTTIKTEQYGNIFSPQNKKLFNIEFKNRLDKPSEYEIKYYAKHSSGEIVWEKEEKISINKKEILHREEEASFEKFGQYNFYVEIKNEAEKINSLYSTVFSYVLTADDGLYNEHHQFNVHAGNFNSPYGEACVELIKKANSGGYRDHPLNWQEAFDMGGSYTTKPVAQAIIDGMNERTPEGSGSVSTLAFGNAFVTGKTIWDAPETEDEYKLWEGYVLYMAKLTKNKKFELWNEPNLNSYSTEDKYPLYVELARRTAKVLHEYDPSIKLGVGCIAAPDEEERGWKFMRGLAECGIFDVDIDAITLHPYTRVPEARIKMAEEYRQYFKENGRDDLELWYTEYSYTLGLRGGVSSRRQVNIDTRQYLSMNCRGLGEEFSRYDIMDDFEHNKTDDEQCWGAVMSIIPEFSETGVACSARDSYIAVAAMNYLLRDASPDGACKTDDVEIEIARYHKNKTDEEMLAVWSTAGDKTITLDLGCDEIMTYDIFGNSKKMFGNNGKFIITATDYVKYLVGKITETKLCDNLAEVNTIKQKGIPDDMITFEIINKSDIDYTPKVRVPNNFELLKQPEFKEGKASFDVKISEEPFESAEISIDLMLDDKVCQSLEVYAECNDNIAELTLSKFHSDMKNVNLWNGVATVKNNTCSKVIGGKIVFMQPDSFKSMFPLQTGPIGPGDIAEISFSYPALDKLGIYSVEAKLMLDDGTESSISQKLDFTVATYAYEKPVIDGIISKGEWNGAAAMYAEDQSQVVMSGWTGKDDLSIKTMVEWDEENLYVAVKAVDDVWFYNSAPASDIWQNDSVQFGILHGTASEVVIGTANTTYEEIGMGQTDGGPVAYRWNTQTDHAAGVIDNCEVMIGREGNNTYYELKIPWSEVAGEDFKPDSGTKIGYSLLVNDNDGNGRKGWIEYASGIGSYKDTNLFTRIELIK